MSLIDPHRFLEAVLPLDGYRCGWAKDPLSKRHTGDKFFDTDEELVEWCLARDAEGWQAYYATATFDTRRRKQDHVLALRALRVDIDVGDGKCYPDLRSAGAAILSFSRDHGYQPYLVASGGGWHCYYALDEDVDRRRWQAAADALKDQLARAGVRTDPTVTADAARILRLPGTHNHKFSPPALVRGGPDIPVNKLSAFPAMPVGTPTKLSTKLPVKAEVSELGSFETAHAPAWGAPVAEACAQVRRLRDLKGNVPEPEWYAMLGVLAFCEDGEALAQEWSSGHPEYTEPETSRKLAQAKAAQSGPTTCARFSAVFPGGCEGCPHAGKVTTPLHLGRNAPAPPGAKEVSDLPALPFPYRWSQSRQMLLPGKEPEDEPLVVVHHPAYVVGLVRSESTRGIALKFRHWVPGTGWEEFVMTGEQLAGQNARTHFARHLPMFHDTAWKAWIRYVTNHQHQLEKGGYGAMYDQFGWKPARVVGLAPKMSFVIGADEITADGMGTASLSERLRGLARDLAPVGDPKIWAGNANRLFCAGLEGVAFNLLASFAAPLIKLLTHESAVLYTYGETGLGKTASTTQVASVWGKPEALQTMEADTAVARFMRFGMVSNLPLIYQDIRFVDPVLVGNEMLQFTQGQEKARGSKTGGLVEQENHWITILFANGNESMHQHLGIAVSGHDDASAMRVWQHALLAGDNPYSPVEYHRITAAMLENRGGVGRAYMSLVLQKAPAIMALLKQRHEHYNVALGLSGAHRYWASLLAATDVAATLVHAWGILEFHPPRIMEWAEHQTKLQKDARAVLGNDGPATLGLFLNAHFGNILVCQRAFKNGLPSVITERPSRTEVWIRINREESRMYVSSVELRKWCTKNHYDFQRTLRELKRAGVMLRDDAKLTLTAGTDIPGAPLTAIEIDAAHPTISGVLRVVEPQSDIVRLGR